MDDELVHDDAATTAHLAAPTDEVWDVLTSPDGVEAWLGAPSTLPPTEGAELDVTDVETATRRRGRVETVDPGRRLGFVWWPDRADGDPADGGEGLGDGASRVLVELFPHEGGTTLVITEVPVRGPRACIASTVPGTATGASAWLWRVAAVEIRMGLAHPARPL